MDEELSLSVYRLVEAIPEGKVLTYGEIAALLGRPRNARLVGRILSQTPPGRETPCHRVVNARGETAPGWTEQAENGFQGVFSPGRASGSETLRLAAMGRLLRWYWKKFLKFRKIRKKPLLFLKSYSNIMRRDCEPRENCAFFRGDPSADCTICDEAGGCGCTAGFSAEYVRF